MMNTNNLTQEERDKYLKSQLSDGIIKILNRYRLVSTPGQKWISKKENSHEQVVFTQKFLVNSDELAAFFRANYLCFAKLKYYREHIDDYEFAKYLPEKGFVKVELWDSDFLKHKTTGKYIDYRFLQRITDIEVFKKFCNQLENGN